MLGSLPNINTEVKRVDCFRHLVYHYLECLICCMPYTVSSCIDHMAVGCSSPGKMKFLRLRLVGVSQV